MLSKFQVYNIVIQYLYPLQSDHHINLGSIHQLEMEPFHPPVIPFSSGNNQSILCIYEFCFVLFFHLFIVTVFV